MKNHHAYQLAQMKATLVENIINGKESVAGAARSLKKSRPTIYGWISRFKSGGVDALLPGKTGPKGGRAINRSSRETEDFVLQVIDDHPEWNIYDVQESLPEEHAMHASTVWRIWKRRRGKDTLKRISRPPPQLYVKEAVGEELQLDTCYPWGRGVKRVCFDCLDDHSRFAFARLFSDATQDSSIAFLHYVIEKAPFIIRSIRTDCGSEWSTRFSVACTLAGIKHIRNEPYHPEHNGKIEKFHDGLKYRCFYVYLYPSDPLAQQNVDLQQWLVWYNYFKKHSGLGMNRRTPAEVLMVGLLSSPLSCVKVMLQPHYRPVKTSTDLTFSSRT